MNKCGYCKKELKRNIYCTNSHRVMQFKKMKKGKCKEKKGMKKTKKEILEEIKEQQKRLIGADLDFIKLIHNSGGRANSLIILEFRELLKKHLKDK